MHIFKRKFRAHCHQIARLLWISLSLQQNFKLLRLKHEIRIDYVHEKETSAKISTVNIVMWC